MAEKEPFSSSDFADYLMRSGEYPDPMIARQQASKVTGILGRFAAVMLGAELPAAVSQESVERFVTFTSSLDLQTRTAFLGLIHGFGSKYFNLVRGYVHASAQQQRDESEILGEKPTKYEKITVIDGEKQLPALAVTAASWLSVFEEEDTVQAKRVFRTLQRANFNLEMPVTEYLKLDGSNDFLGFHPGEFEDLCRSIIREEVDSKGIGVGAKELISQFLLF